MEKSKSAPHLDDNPDLAPPITFHLPQGNMDTRRSNNQDEKWKIGLRSYDDDETYVLKDCIHYPTFTLTVIV